MGGSRWGREIARTPARTQEQSRAREHAQLLTHTRRPVHGRRLAGHVRPRCVSECARACVRLFCACAQRAAAHGLLSFVARAGVRVRVPSVLSIRGLLTAAGSAWRGLSERLRRDQSQPSSFKHIISFTHSDVSGFCGPGAAAIMQPPERSRQRHEKCRSLGHNELPPTGRLLRHVVSIKKRAFCSHFDR